MKLHKAQSFNKIGIYAIVNSMDNKMYIGKSKNIYLRIKDHITRLNTKNTDENIHLIRAWYKYGKDNFKYIILEHFEKFDESLLKERELYWILFYDTTNRKKGYNLRLDTSTNCEVLEETKRRLKKSRNERKKNFPNLDIENGIKMSMFWKNNPDKKKKMAEKMSFLKIKYRIEQYDKSGTLVKEWKNIKEILENNPSYKWQNIYSVCNGYKPSIYGYIWKKIKITSEDIVRSSEKFEIEESESN